MSIRLSKTCAAKSAAKIDTFFELHNTFPTLFSDFFADCMSNADINQGAFSSGKSALMMNLDGLMLSISVRQKTLKFHKHLNINVVMALLHGVAYFEAR